MKRLIAIAIAGMLFCGVADAQVYSNPSSVGVAAPGQVPGTTTNDSANTGNVGEYVSSQILVGSTVNIPLSTNTDITSISLTAGDWDVGGIIAFQPATGTITNALFGWISTSSATLPAAPNSGAYWGYNPATPSAANAAFINPVGMIRISIATPTTVYISARANFSVSTMGGYGFIGARRVR